MYSILFVIYPYSCDKTTPCTLKYTFFLSSRQQPDEKDINKIRRCMSDPFWPNVFYLAEWQLNTAEVLFSLCIK
jgi:hypothetical protein